LKFCFFRHSESEPMSMVETKGEFYREIEEGPWLTLSGRDVVCSQVQDGASVGYETVREMFIVDMVEYWSVGMRESIFG
jgi:hypothetical protein